MTSSRYPNLLPYKLDSQTIIVDCIMEVEDSIPLSYDRYMILQRCEEHAVDAIKARLIKKCNTKSHVIRR
jgi:hypothetical protein